MLLGGLCEIGKNLTVIDAKHDNYYVCGYDGTKVIKEPEFLSFSMLEAVKKDYDNLLISNDNERYEKNCDLKLGFISAVKNNL